MSERADVTIISNVLMADGIGRHSALFNNVLSPSLNVKLKVIGAPNFKDIPANLFPKILADHNTTDNIPEAKVYLWTYILGLQSAIPLIARLPSNGIKICYSMFESDKIPQLWVDIINSKFDKVLVPDPWLIPVYKNSGVNKPINYMTFPVLLEKFLDKPVKANQNDVFCFGISGGLLARKQHLKVLEAFHKLYGNNLKFKLKIHGRFGSYANTIQAEINKLNLFNVEFIKTPLSEAQYIEFMQSLDCYVFPSSGEGFSVTPREAMALGIPTIVSNNSAHKTICDTGYVVSLPANKKVPAIYEVFGGQQIGNFYECAIEDLIDRMKDVVENYSTHLEKVKPARTWLAQYLHSNLTQEYTNYIKSL